MAMDIESSVDPPTSSELGDMIIQMTQFIEDVKKLGSLAIMLEIEDWEYIVSNNEPHSARRELMRKFIDRGKGMKELYIILMEPAVDARRSAEKIGQILPVECRRNSTSCPPSSSTEGIPQQYRKSYIEKIGTRYNCTRPNVLNCLSDYRADWASIGSYLVGKEDVDCLKQYCNLPGDEVAYLVEKWWRTTINSEFTWERLRDAIILVAKKKYDFLIHHSEAIISANEKVETDISILLDEFDKLLVAVLDELKRTDCNFIEIEDTLKVCSQLEPHDARYLEKIFDKLSVKSIDNFFQNAKYCWNFLDVGILKILIKKFIKSDKIKSRMENYNSRLIKFRETPVAFVIKALQKRNIHPRKLEDCHGYKPVIQNLGLNPYCCTLAHLDNLRIDQCDKLRELGLLENALMVLNSAELCCVIVTWLVTEDEVCLFEEMFKICIKEGIFLEDNSITSIQINGKVLQSMERALLEASTRDDVKRIDHLLQSWNRHKHNINKTNKEGKTSLIVASELGHSGVVALLVEEDAVNIDYQMHDTLWTALFFAYHGGHQNTVKILEEYGASKAIKDKNGRCAQELSQVLLKPEKPRKSFRERLSSGLKDTLSFNKKKIFKYCEIGDCEEVKKILSKEGKVDVKDGKPKNWTPLMHACKNGHYEIVKVLLDNGADVHVKSTMNDWTPLAVAASWDKLRIANLLLKKRANPNDIIDPDESHYSILMYISDMGYVEMARALLKYGADLEIPNKLDNATPLFGAIDSEDEQMVKLFLEYGADFNRQAKTNWTPLMECARRSSSKICKMLIDCGAKTEVVMQGAGKVSGEAAIHVACYFGQAEVAKVLIESGTDVNRENEMGLTPLMIATKCGHADVTKTLVECESLDINQLHKANGFSALFWAATTGNIEICEILLQHKALSDLGGINIVDCAPILQKKAMKQLFIKYKSVNLSVQHEVIVSPQMTEENVVHQEIPEETYLPLQMKSHEESQTKVAKTSESQEEREDVMERDDTVFDSKISQTTQLETAIESSKVIQQIQAEVIEFPHDNELPIVETRQITTVGDGDTSDVCAEHEEIAGEEEKIPEKVMDDDSSLYGDEEVFQPSKSETISQTTCKLQEEKKQVLKYRNMTLEERKALLEQIWRNYSTFVIDQRTSGRESTKGVQQVDICQQQIITST